MFKVTLNLIAIVVFINAGWFADGLSQSFQPENICAQSNRIISNNDTVKSSVKSPTGAMIRSLIFPGWGQVYNKKYLKAVLIFGVETGIIANSIYLNQKYKASQTDLDREFYINNRNLSNWWLVGVLLFSMADAFVDAHLSDFDEGSDLSIRIILPNAVDRLVGVQLTICKL